jgi:hypothetical protein
MQQDSLVDQFMKSVIPPIQNQIISQDSLEASHAKATYETMLQTMKSILHRFLNEDMVNTYA